MRAVGSSVWYLSARRGRGGKLIAAQRRSSVAAICAEHCPQHSNAKHNAKSQAFLLVTTSYRSSEWLAALARSVSDVTPYMSRVLRFQYHHLLYDYVQ